MDSAVIAALRSTYCQKEFRVQALACLVPPEGGTLNTKRALTVDRFATVIPGAFSMRRSRRS
jgi:hypothetical protein